MAFLKFFMRSVDYFGREIGKRLKENGNSYLSLFSLVKTLESSDDVREFMGGYVNLMKLRIQEEINEGSGEFIPGHIRRGRGHVNDIARVLARDNLDELGVEYETFYDEEIHEDWCRLVSELCPDYGRTSRR